MTHPDHPPRSATLPASYFEKLYRSDPDPWQFATSDYEREKYAATLAVLRPSYRFALEVGCSIGVFTHALAEHCRSLLSIDGAIQPLAEARQRCADLPHVRFARMVIPGDRPIGRYDLIVLSEVLYYFDEQDLEAVAKLVQALLAPGGDVVLVHWTGATDYPLTGDEAADGFTRALARVAPVVRQQRTDRYRLDLLRRRTT